MTDILDFAQLWDPILDLLTSHSCPPLYQRTEWSSTWFVYCSRVIRKVKTVRLKRNVVLPIEYNYNKFLKTKQK